jgi:ABC-type multidrug transport system ATPase subunit
VGTVRKLKLGGFSGGMRQRFGIAQALIGSPRLVIVDEPTAGLDPEERNRFLNLLAEIGENVVVILSTHIVEDVTDLCPRMAIINQGQVLLTGEPLEAIRSLEGRSGSKTVSARRRCPRCSAPDRIVDATGRRPPGGARAGRRPAGSRFRARSAPGSRMSISANCTRHRAAIAA